MPWQQQGGSGGNNSGGPWGSGPGGGSAGNQPPDIEEMIQKGKDRFKQMLPGGMGSKTGLSILVVAALSLWLATGIYRVDQGERAVELLFGKFASETQAGLHFWFPTPIGGVTTRKVDRTNTISIGFRGAGGTSNMAAIRDVSEESLMLTGDQNIIDIDFVVQWRIKNLRDYLFNIREPEGTTKLAAESAIREVIGQSTLEDALSKGRQLVEDKTKTVLQKILDDYGAGIFIAEVKMQKVEPPQPVIDAFNDVQRARQDKDRQQNEADAYRNDIIPKAQGEAARLVQEATAYREQLVKEAEGEAKRFLSVYEAYKTGKKVTIQRLYLERMQDVMKDSEKIIIDNSKGGQGVVPYLPLPEIKKRSDAKGQSEENAEGSR
ncbi:MAG: FtsH protease activity modulator HflK [Rhodospirillaceae bacterium]|nr:FtsH protease activity modulator HflK [Rhodospirillaceae bacterium]